MIFILAAVLTLVLTPLTVSYAHRTGMLDEPDPRRLHSGTVARGGGIIMVAVFCAALAVAPWVPGNLLNQPVSWVVSLFVVLLSLLGYWDDHQPLPAAWRAGVQLVCATVLCLSLAPGPGTPLSWLIITALIVACVWWINLFNFMDGSNGMAAAQALFLGAALGWLSLDNGADSPNPAALCSLLTGAVALGFLPWNFPKPRVFMGDVGSYGLAAMLAVSAAMALQQGLVNAATAMLLPAVFVVDASLTLLRRMSSGQRWYDAHREHLYQRLAAVGPGQGGALLIYALVNVAFIWPAVLLQRHWPERDLVITLTGYVVLAVGWIVSNRWLEYRQQK